MFEKDYSFPIGNFVVEDPARTFHFIPYNVQYCDVCKTTQTKYLGDLNLIYEDNFAGAYGSIRNTMNDLFANFILENKNVRDILEIGAGNGSLSESILDKSSNSYTIVDPSYCGPKEKRCIVPTFFENYKEPSSSNTVVMSHVYEHFYDPCLILEKIKELQDVDYVYLSFPDLEGFIKEGVYHVLNPEHTFYVENEFIVNLFDYFNFKLGRTYSHKNHSIFFEFIRDKESKSTKAFPKNRTAVEDTRHFFERVLENVETANKSVEGEVYMWPCSMHSLFCLSLGLRRDGIRSVLDNSPLKIGKYLYGYGYICESFSTVINSEEPKTILLTGGCYNTEIQTQVKANSKNKVIVL